MSKSKENLSAQEWQARHDAACAIVARKYCDMFAFCARVQIQAVPQRQAVPWESRQLPGEPLGQRSLRSRHRSANSYGSRNAAERRSLHPSGPLLCALFALPP
jgi:hypothetical protein